MIGFGKNVNNTQNVRHNIILLKITWKLWESTCLHLAIHVVYIVSVYLILAWHIAKSTSICTLINTYPKIIRLIYFNIRPIGWKIQRHICCIALVFYVFIIYVLFFKVCLFFRLDLYIVHMLCFVSKKPKTPEDYVKSGMEEMTETSFGQWPIQSFYQTCWQNWLSIKRRYIQVVLIPGTRSYICTGKRPLTWVICY